MHNYAPGFRRTLYLLFALSGFSGLVYESIWAHYLKLFLGHAAYAQTLVIGIFMGGMALGAWVAGKFSKQTLNLLTAYALVEAIIGIAAVLFHPMFVHLAPFVFERVLPGFASPAFAESVTWGVAAALILPQSILLGMTFPLMSTGLIRLAPNNTGETLAFLYFSNSIGAAIGVLASGFFLIEWVGLPGTVTLAGILSLLVAIVAWLLAKAIRQPAPVTQVGAEPMKHTGTALLPRRLLAMAAITGAASFCYEIGWIRMLSMVLGSSTHSFELMLSAFILGLALGGLWIHKKIDKIHEPAGFLGWVQIVMGIFALASLLVFGATFNWMSAVLQALARSDAGYLGFTLSSHIISLLVMLPATFCAGMTLPLMTSILIQRRYGERAVANIYAANTIGAILGILLATHILMPYLGLKWVVIAGAMMDIGLGLYFLLPTYSAKQAIPKLTAIMAGGIPLAFVSSTVSLDLLKLGSGVYRTGTAALGQANSVLFYRDGKTASIALFGSPDGTVMVSTNGKPDASINMAGGPLTADEITMTMAGALPLAYKPDARRAANIGMGSGLTTHTLLSYTRLEKVDTIEIEPAMVQAAKIGFGPRVSRAFTDPRSQIVIEDAKTFFAINNKKYDLIVSEPSNPWVSGVASLFSKEFYHTINRHLNHDGLLVQWIQGYEINFKLVASILNALSTEFEDFAVYHTDNANLLIVAKPKGKLGGLSPNIFQDKQLAAEMNQVGIRSIEDLAVRKLGNKALLSPLMAIYAAPANSDYFPYVDLHASRSRFLQQNLIELAEIGTGTLPTLEMLGAQEQRQAGRLVTTDRYFFRTQRIGNALAAIRGLSISNLGTMSLAQQQAVLLLRSPASCSGTSEVSRNAIYTLGSTLTPYLSGAELRPLWELFEQAHCISANSKSDLNTWVELFKAIGSRNGEATAHHASELLHMANELTLDEEKHGFLLAASMLGNLSVGDKQRAHATWEQYAPALLKGRKPNLLLKWMVLLSRQG
ncbi:MAG: fused MFS/spermidine synthase [Chitinivorax sp.]